MRALEKNIKGFNVLELIAVVLIIGVISAAAYPKFSGWKTQREIRDAALKIKSLILGINGQVQRGMYSFVQVYVNITDTEIIVASKGMKADTLATKINDGASAWNDPAGDTTRCNITSTTYWDDDGSADDNTVIQVQKLVFDGDKFASNFSGEAAVCFSKDARWFSGAGNFLSVGGGDTSVDQTMFLCIKDDDVPTCAINTSGEPTSVVDNVYSIDWTRFGDVTVDKWSTLLNEWVLQ